MSRLNPPPLCPVCYLETAYCSADESDDTWACDVCRRFGFIHSKDYLKTHPNEDAIFVAGIDHSMSRNLLTSAA